MKATRSPLRITVTLTFSPWSVVPLVAAYLCYQFAVETWERNVRFFHDDAYITLRYVRNLLEGVGLVWNPGERVQGYTSFLHAMLLALLGRSGMNLEQAARTLGLASYYALIATVAGVQLARRVRGRRHPLDFLPVLLVAGTGPLIVWARGGLEGPLFALLVTAGAFALLGALDPQANPRLFSLAGLLFALAVLTRPDGGVFVAVSTAAAFLSTRDRLLNALRVAVPAAVILLPYVLWCYWYYGDLVPNTFYAKATDLSWVRIRKGLEYAGEYATTPPYLAFLLPLTVPALLLRPALRRSLAYLLAMIVGYVAVIVTVGGDHMPAYRFFLPVTPLLIYAVYLGVTSLLPAERAVVCAGVYAALIGPVLMQRDRLELNAVFGDSAAVIGRPVGEYMGKLWPAGSLVALNTAGSTPYFAPKLRFIDMLGLNDRRIARRRVEASRTFIQQNLTGHWKGDGAYVLDRDPDYIVMGGAAGSSYPWFLSDLEISEDERFRQRYEFLQVTFTAPNVFGEKVNFAFYRRKPAVPGDAVAKASAERANQ